MSQDDRSFWALRALARGIEAAGQVRSGINGLRERLDRARVQVLDDVVGLLARHPVRTQATELFRKKPQIGAPDQAEAQAGEAPIVEAPIVAVQTVEAPIVVAQTVEAPIVEAPIVEESIAVAQTVEAPIVEESIAIAQTVEAPIVEESIAIAQTVEAPIVEESIAVAQTVEAPIVGAQTAEPPVVVVEPIEPGGMAEPAAEPGPQVPEARALSDESTEIESSAQAPIRGEGRLVLLPKDPQWSFAYWDLDSVQQAMTRGGARLKVYSEDTLVLDDPVAAEAGCYYFRTPADRLYRAELWADGEALLFSAPVSTPPCEPRGPGHPVFVEVTAQARSVEAAQSGGDPSVWVSGWPSATENEVPKREAPASASFLGSSPGRPFGGQTPAWGGASWGAKTPSSSKIE